MKTRGWEEADKNSAYLIPKQSILLPARKAVIEFIKCGCIKSGCATRCSCKSNGLPCTPLCKFFNSNCENPLTEISIEPDGDAEDEDDENEGDSEYED